MVLRALQELFNQTRLFKHWISIVLFIKPIHHNSPTTDNQIGDKGAESIARALQSNTSIQTLDIHGARFHQTHHSSPSTHTQQ